jgi:hypothetical protein
MFRDTSLQIFLTLIHGSFISTFLYDYILRNSVRVYLNGPEWNYISHIALGVVFIAIIAWAILSVWGKIRRNLLISLVILIIIFIIRMANGIPDLMNKNRQLPKSQYTEEFVSFITQMIIHFFGVIFTYLLSRKAD